MRGHKRIRKQYGTVSYVSTAGEGRFSGKRDWTIILRAGPVWIFGYVLSWFDNFLKTVMINCTISMNQKPDYFGKLLIYKKDIDHDFNPRGNSLNTWTVAHPAPVAYTNTLVGRPGSCSGRGGVRARSSSVSVNSMPAVASDTVSARCLENRTKEFLVETNSSK